MGPSELFNANPLSLQLKAQAQMQAVFGDDKEAMQAAERDMKTIRAKRSLSQGGVLPPNKTKYKKRSVRAKPHSFRFVTYILVTS